MLLPWLLMGVLFFVFLIGFGSAYSAGKSLEKEGKVVSKKTCIIAGILSTIIWIVLLGIVSYFSAETENMFLYLVFAFFGWGALNRIQPAMFIWMPLVGWLIYFFIKFILSVLIGVFVAPYVIGKKVTQLVNYTIM